MSYTWRVAAAAAALLLTASCATQAGDSTEDPLAGASDTGTPTSENTDPDASAPAEPIPRASGEAVAPVEGLPTVTLDESGAPSISVPADAEPPAELVAQTLIKGPGAPVTDGSEISAQYAGWLWDGTPFDSSWDRGGIPLDAVLSSGQLIDGWVVGLIGQTVGSQVLLVIPPELGYGDADMGSIPPNSTLVFVVDILSATASEAGPIPRASGQTVPPVEGLPVVTLDDAGAPSIAIPADAEPPAELVAQTLIKGEGGVVAEGAEISAQYAGWLWDGTQFDSSWDRGGEPMDASLAPGQLIEGWAQGLVGQTEGSQVLLIIPPELGYGEAGSGPIPPNATLVFVVDILSAS
ncbi:MAG: FKBP-type peptidyl-prolyl cis-trans isomerase [Bifidobacteriaceae bacterium]|jgi:peptidylprolyl isomerase|nr:FKBP-type peptidyl-prolyl cis-trans isomerase [Bifidobacteriaceae bacterium]